MPEIHGDWASPGNQAGQEASCELLVDSETMPWKRVCDSSRAKRKHENFLLPAGPVMNVGHPVSALESTLSTRSMDQGEPQALTMDLAPSGWKS